MTENEQIQEMAKVLGEIQEFGINRPRDEERYPVLYPSNKEVADYLISKDYRKVKRGEWVEHTEIGAMNNYWECSVCHWKTVSFTEMRHSNFCPNCGADMRKAVSGDG